MRGECLGLVGESGCGKTSLSKLIMRAIKPDSGTITYNDGTRDIDVLGLKGQALRDFRPRLQMIFQDPVSSLSPRMTVLNIIREPLEIHGRGSSEEQLPARRRPDGGGRASTGASSTAIRTAFRAASASASASPAPWPSTPT